jgi:hypothetical protein
MKKVYACQWHQLGHQFQMKYEILGRAIKFKDENIGKIWCDNPETGCGYFAAAYGDFGSNLGSPKGIKIWNRYTQDWTNIDIPSISTLIGWK